MRNSFYAAILEYCPNQEEYGNEECENGCVAIPNGVVVSGRRRFGRIVGYSEAIRKRVCKKPRSESALQPLLRSPISENGDLRRAFRAALPLRRYTQC